MESSARCSRRMPATEQAARLTDAYRARLLAVRLQAVTVTTRRWSQITLTDLDGSFDTWLEAAVAVLTMAQRTGVALTDAYLAAFLSAELGRQSDTQGVDPDEFAGQDRAGRPLARALGAAIITTKVALRQGRNGQDALRMGRNRAVRTVATETLAAPRDALGSLVEFDERVKGHRRVIAPGACGACLASASGDVQGKAEPLKVHRFCRCQSEPVVAGVRETVRRPTGHEVFNSLSAAQQGALFHGRGGEEKAALIRSGEVPFESLIAPVPLKAEPDGITEAPLAALSS